MRASSSFKGFNVINHSSIQCSAAAAPRSATAHTRTAWLQRLVFLFMAMLTVCLLGGLSLSAHADETPIPPLRAHINDTTGTLSRDQIMAMEQKLQSFEQTKGSQVVVLMVPKLGTEDTIETYARRVFDKWQIGRKNVDDGVLFVIAKDDHKMRIEPGYGLEGAITDLKSARIIRNTVAPRFQQNDFAGGINAAVDQMVGLINGEELPGVSPKQQGAAPEGGGSPWLFLLFFLFFLPPVFFAILAAVVVYASTGSFLLAILAAIVGGVIRGLLSFGGRGGGGGSSGLGGGGRGRRGGVFPMPFPIPMGGGGFGGGMGGGGFSGGGGMSGGGGASGSW